MGQLALRIEGRTFRDPSNREVRLRGLNVAADSKVPRKPDIRSHVAEGFFDGDDVSFVGRPFTVDEAHGHFARIRRYGFDTLRYVFTWEAIEHAGPGKYDEAWIEHTVSILKLAKEYGFYVILDPHQDVWSRFCGGSGAPMWTLYACGLDPHGFVDTEAAIIHNLYENPSEFPKMIWSTNYHRYACQVVFTLFFAGRDFAPKAIIDGQNIQDYLQGHFLAACQHLAKRVHEAGDLENDVVIGWESMNEPNRGLIGYSDISVIPTEQKLQKGTSPTAWQAILTAAGRACEVATWDMGRLGPYRSGTTLVDPKGTTAWLPADFDESKYGWRRDSGWKLGTCIWALHGVWDPADDSLLRKDYFSQRPGMTEHITYEKFTNTYFMDFYRRSTEAMRSIHRDAIMFCQPPVLEVPPSLKGTEDDDPRMVYSPHFYEAITLMTKNWNPWWNIDVFGLLRGRYLSPPFAIKFGETAIRNCIRDQLSAIRQEGIDYLGEHPCVLTEFGIPFDMNDKSAYKTGDYRSQCAAMDANHYAVEGSGMEGFTMWCYVAMNNHEWGDQWNGEDLSIFSLDDTSLPVASPTPSNNTSTQSLNNPQSLDKIFQPSAETVSPSSLKSSLSTPSMALETPTKNVELTGTPGFRAAEAYVRPGPIAVAGDLTSYGFDLRGCTFSMSVTASTPTPKDAPTEIFLPEYHFPERYTKVEVSGGRWTIDYDRSKAVPIQKLRWWHAPGEQTLKVSGVVRRSGTVEPSDEDGYLSQYWQSGCRLM